MCIHTYIHTYIYIYTHTQFLSDTGTDDSASLWRAAVALTRRPSAGKRVNPFDISIIMIIIVIIVITIIIMFMPMLMFMFMYKYCLLY